MADTSTRKSEHDLGNVNKALYDKAKNLWGWSMTIKILTAFVGVFATVVLNQTPFHLPFVVALAAIGAEVLQWLSDQTKGNAESLKRKLEYKDGFGWTIEGTEIADILAGMTVSTRRNIAKKPSEVHYASSEVPSSRRVIENLRESAWWSKHLSAFMRTMCAVTLTLTITTAVAALYYASISLASFSDRQNTTRIVTTLLSLVVSVGLWRFFAGYFSFNKKAERYEQAAATALKGEPEKIATLKLLHEYQIARASAPILPDWAWKFRRDSLNELWDSYCKANTTLLVASNASNDLEVPLTSGDRTDSKLSS